MSEQVPLTGTESRDAGAASVSSHTPQDWKVACDVAIARLATINATFTAEDVRAVVGDPPNHPSAMGARFLAAAKAGLIERIGYQRPVRASRHANPLAVWRGKP
jgi:hypothetical protein